MAVHHVVSGYLPSSDNKHREMLPVDSGLVKPLQGSLVDCYALTRKGPFGPDQVLLPFISFSEFLCGVLAFHGSISFYEWLWVYAYLRLVLIL